MEEDEKIRLEKEIQRIEAETERLKAENKRLEEALDMLKEARAKPLVGVEIESVAQILAELIGKPSPSDIPLAFELGRGYEIRRRREKEE